MSNNQNWNKMGEDIKDALSEALRSGDFTNLNDLVSQSVVNTLNEVGKHIPFVETAADTALTAQPRIPGTGRQTDRQIPGSRRRSVWPGSR